MTLVAIDFGTSNTVVCVEDPATKQPRTLRLDPISRRFETVAGPVEVVPTLLFVGPQIVIGERVRAERLGSDQPERLFQAFKRDLVAEYVPPARLLDGRSYSSETVAELFLQAVMASLDQAGIHPTQAVFTVPVGSFERYLSWLRGVAERLALANIQVIDESTAAALGYAVINPGSLVLVLDFGGGTLDLSLVRTVSPSPKALKAEVVAKADAYVGGIDIDTWIIEDYLERIGSSRAEIGKVGWQNLLEVAERLKIRLSLDNSASESWFDDERFMAHELKLTQTDLEDLLESRQLLEQVRQALDEVLLLAQSRGVSKAEIERVLLVGGSSQIPAIQRLAISYFGRRRVLCDKPFEAVAHGALVLGQQVQIEDHLHRSYAIRLWDPYHNDYTYLPLFEKGTRYPCQRPDPLVLQVSSDGQSEIRLDLGEVGEVAQAEVVYDALGRMSSRRLRRQTDFRSLSVGRAPICLARLDPPGKAGLDRIRVRFAINEKRLLLATVEDLQTGRILVQDSSVAKLS